MEHNWLPQFFMELVKILVSWLGLKVEIILKFWDEITWFFL